MSSKPSQQMPGLRAFMERVRQVGEFGVVVGAPGDVRQTETPPAADAITITTAGPPKVAPPATLTQGQLLAIHEYGDPSRGIPERSVLRSTLREQRARALDMLTSEVQAHLANEKIPVEKFFARIALLLEAEVKRKFGSSELAPNTRATIKAKGSAKPLIDSGELRRSIEGKVIKLKDLKGEETA